MDEHNLILTQTEMNDIIHQVNEYSKLDEQTQVWKSKADKWDALEKEVSACYGKENANGEWEEYDDDDEENNYDLVTIGEKAAIAFGFL